ncbi:hypothetical protein SynSYN20_01706 [Synechococcus sp. SYN20]|nr:hypothetical protein SynSYN20_01706 [Synechococcus sp. SYN20]
MRSKATALQAFAAPSEGNNNLNRDLFQDSKQVSFATYETIFSGITSNEPLRSETKRSCNPQRETRLNNARQARLQQPKTSLMRLIQDL